MAKWFEVLLLIGIAIVFLGILFWETKEYYKDEIYEPFGKDKWRKVKR